MNLTQIKAEILTGSFDNAQLQELMETVQYARAQLGKTVKRQLQPGASVSFVSNRSGQKILGTVERVAIKNIVVCTHLGLYRVPANMIEVV
jgi:ketopantoate hydroxymethyltransferase